jgi:phosphate starvation-inducible membrane PsiE
MTTIIIILYLIGCILSYGRINASMYAIDEEFIKFIPPTPAYLTISILSLFSWLMFIAVIFVYFENNEHYFFKWSYKPLWDEWNKNNQ